MKIYHKIFLLLLLLLPFFSAVAQNKKIEKLESVVAQAVKKAYPASVRMWSFDVQQNQRTGGQFSGVVVSVDGYILTAAHTISPGKNYKVFFPDGKECIAVALGRIDEKDKPGIPDAGMMKITDKGIWPYAEMGYSSSLVKDEPCISLSYPETLDQKFPTLRLGKIAETNNQYGFIRSTCKMEPGDSGGPLFDYKGRVIGLHSAIDVREDQNFEIPVDTYRKYWTALQAEVNYTTLPEKKDQVPVDPLSEIIKKESKDLNPDLGAVKIDDNIAFRVVSNVKDSILTTASTLLNYKKRQFLITKNTMVGLNPQVSVKGINIPVTIIAKDPENDLVLLQSAGEIKGGIDLNEAKKLPQVVNMGTLLYTVNPSGKLHHSISSSGILSLPKVSSQPYFGAMVAYNSSPIQFSLVKADSPAGRAGLKVGDELISINGKTLSKANEFASEISKFWPGDVVTVEWLSANEKKTKTFVLDVRLSSISNHPTDKFDGGKSQRRDGFKDIFAHDGAIKPVDSGTPIFDWKGNFYGINIARFSRTSTIGIPVEVIQKFIKQSLEK